MIGKWLNLKVDSDKASTYCDQNMVKTKDLPRLLRYNIISNTIFIFKPRFLCFFFSKNKLKLKSKTFIIVKYFQI